MNFLWALFQMPCRCGPSFGPRLEGQAQGLTAQPNPMVLKIFLLHAVTFYFLFIYFFVNPEKGLDFLTSCGVSEAARSPW